MGPSQGSCFFQAQGSQGAVEPALLLSTPCPPSAAHGSAGSAVGGFGPAAGGSHCYSPLARFPELPYGSRCPEFEPWGALGVERSGWLCHPSNVPTKQDQQ